VAAAAAFGHVSLLATACARYGLAAVFAYAAVWVVVLAGVWVVRLRPLDRLWCWRVQRQVRRGA
jgi:hypothetical protein